MIEKRVVLNVFPALIRVLLTQACLHLVLLFVVHDVLKLAIDDHGGEQLVEVATQVT